MVTSEIKNLFEQLRDSLQKKDPKSFLTDGRPIYIYGAGNVGKDIFRVLKGRGLCATAFLDRNAKSGSVCEDAPILKPEEESISKAQRQHSHVIIGIFNRETDMLEIMKLLKSLGYGRVTSFLEFHDYFALELGDRFWLTSRGFFMQHEEQIAAAYELWSDDLSRDIYKAVLKFRFTMIYEAMPNPILKNQYFPPDLPPWPSPLRFVDCGAYDGDTLRYLLDALTAKKVEAIAAFEPDLFNFSKLVQFLYSRAAKVTDTICLFPCGVSSETTQIQFSSGQGEGSCVSDNGNSMIQCVALDEALPVFRPNMIKMDIEGSEYAAMLGAQRTIKQFRPRLAICLYHRPEHLWTIPLLAGTWLQGGSHYLRIHAHNALELVYYWFPDPH